MALDERFELLSHVVEIATSSVDADERLNSILVAVNNYYQARCMALFVQHKGGTPFVLAHAWPNSLLDERNLPSFTLDEGLMGKVALSRQVVQEKVTPDTDDRALKSIAEIARTAVLLPVVDDRKLYGVAALILNESTWLDDDDLRVLLMIAREMAGTMRNYDLYLEAKKRIAELNVLSDMGRYAVSTIELNELLDTVASICAKLLGAEGGLVRIQTKNHEQKELTAQYGNVPDEYVTGPIPTDICSPQPVFPGLIRTRGTDDSERKGILCVPLTFKRGHKGHLLVFEKKVREQGELQRGFTLEDQKTINTMGVMISSALENALTMHSIETLAQRNEEMVQFLGTIFEISTVLMNTMDFDETVQIILHALIHPAGFDHDHVILFLVDDLSGVLRTVAEMQKSHFISPVKELRDTLYEVQGSIFDDHLEPSPEVIDLKLPLDPQKSILAKTVLEEKPILVDNPAKDPQVNPLLKKVLGEHAFVSVPMFAKGKAVGVLVVSNSLSGRNFVERDVKFLSMLAQLGGLSVETSRLYQSLEKANKELAYMRNRLLEADKLAALGEIAAGVAHEIRNPLVSIGGFTRRIRKKVGDDSQITPYLDVIIEEVTRLESTLNEMLDFSNEARDHFSEFDLNQIMDEALELLERELSDQGIEIQKKYGKDLPMILCDDRQVKHVFFNIFLNAVQAMANQGGFLTIRSFAVMREGKQFVAGEVTDNGGGIPMDVIHNIFNPFFTTKPNGSGLGLSIVHKIVNRHFGHVEVHNSEGEGASFLVTLPAAEEGRAYLK
ncbi:GAF domain-containing protein [Dethiosulfatarculus sandiegensis]|uniref:histidine kinase n=1 Tax=Dethiosulfatarculus sandiegensis TaxID=1429043 RepID=A0A0D2JV38_9BACT|nr:GAF domain-containing protein [Dethiosulfatarculus sandiegensis]KIX13420.1 hypothetical protein X474_14265 [Dethiosulfatarculus sandiegensis]